MPPTHTIARTLTLSAAALALAACADSPTAPRSPAAPAALQETATNPASGRLATIELAGRFPALYLQNADGSNRFRVHFRDVRDEIPGNDIPFPIDVTDFGIFALGPAKWSPDGSRLAVVVSMGNDVSEIVVMNADGSDMFVASMNKQIILGDIDWSPDSRRIAYAMSTSGFGRAADLFVTDLAASAVRRLTTTQSLSIFDEYRWDERGAGLWFTQLQGVTPDETNRVFGVSYVSATGSGTPVATGRRVVGDPQGLARDGTWALAMRTPRGGTWPTKEFVRESFGPVPDVVLASGALLYAELLEGEHEALLVSADATDPYSSARRYEVRGLYAAPTELRATLPIGPAATSIALLRRPGRE